MGCNRPIKRHPSFIFYFFYFIHTPTVQPQIGTYAFISQSPRLANPSRGTPPNPVPCLVCRKNGNPWPLSTPLLAQSSHACHRPLISIGRSFTASLFLPRYPKPQVRRLSLLLPTRNCSKSVQKSCVHGQNGLRSICLFFTAAGDFPFCNLFSRISPERIKFQGALIERISASSSFPTAQFRTLFYVIFVPRVIISIWSQRTGHTTQGGQFPGYFGPCPSLVPRFLILREKRKVRCPFRTISSCLFAASQEL